MNSKYHTKLSQKATYLRVYEGKRMLYGEEVSDVIKGLEERIAELESHIQSLKVINQYIDEGCPDISVVRSEIGEVISRAEGTYFAALKEQGE